MSYYLEARRHDQEMRKRTKKNKERAERRKEAEARKIRDPFQLLIIEGRSSKIPKAPEGLKLEDALMPWQGKKDNMIDRFDVRAVLDVIQEYSRRDDPQANRPVHPPQVDCMLNYERFRGILEAVRLKMPPNKHLERIGLEVRRKLVSATTVVQDDDDNNTQSNNHAASAAQGAPRGKAAGVDGHYGPAKELYNRVGMSYGGGNATASANGPAAASSSVPTASDLDQNLLALLSSGSEDESSDESESESEAEGQALPEGDVDHVAEVYGVSESTSGYSYSRLLRYERREREAIRQRREVERERAGKKGRKRKKARKEGTATAGPGRINPYGPASSAVRGYGDRRSPTYDDYEDPLPALRARRRERDRRERERRNDSAQKAAETGASGDKGGGSNIEYITTFSFDDSVVADDADEEVDEEDKNGPSHLQLMEDFFPSVAQKLSGGKLTRPAGAAQREEPAAEEEKKSAPKPAGKPVPKEKKELESLTPAERLKLKMRLQLNKQIKKDQAQEKAALIKKKRDEKAMALAAMVNKEGSVRDGHDDPHHRARRDDGDDEDDDRSSSTKAVGEKKRKEAPTSPSAAATSRSKDDVKDKGSKSGRSRSRSRMKRRSRSRDMEDRRRRSSSRSRRRDDSHSSRRRSSSRDRKREDVRRDGDRRRRSSRSRSRGRRDRHSRSRSRDRGRR